ncbi:MAG: hypothetical protein COS36_06980 [Candidatus Altarchaeum sp. CG03_land_8_20_14_0_80_32_618]|mgnify:CR=1 FL=1|nr:DNA-binding protein [Candidatus Altarchaeum hamiconexum]OIQ05265.1 MAG: hypothetical protein AUK59_04535 [Candidatus Altarchaeum sp. CG2_30_32_3053]PIV27087.1 MAG: hypothetical protein COS36_06980 [Candidatus Altarchaeum sp. CG03_land_8_20_14_0_80_32_618]PJC13238.1 MAG: hypothetical protein CO063_04580 [Candidatus Altarchaeum sp. CG_4_9_14_0_8_um_filter_32_206]
MPDDELGEIRKRKMQQMFQERMQEQYRAEEQERQVSQQLKTITDKILTSEASERLNNIRFAMPDFASQIEILLVQLYQAGKIRGQIDDKQFKEILIRLKSNKSEESGSITRISK